MQRRRSRDCSDIDEVLFLPIIVLIVVAVAGSVILLLVYFSQTKTADVERYNARAVMFNNLPQSTREALAPLLSKSTDADMLIVPKDPPQSLKEIFQTGLHWFLLIMPLAFSLLTFCCYWNKKHEVYHFADLPFGRAYGWVLLFIMLPFGWPFLLGSRIFMWCENRPKKLAEQAEIKRVAVEELTLEENLQVPQFDERAKRAYIEFRTLHFRDSKLSQETRLRKEIDQQKSGLKHYGEKIAELQRGIGQNQAELKQLESVAPDRAATRAEAKSEWEQILNMRGVAKLTASKRKAKPRDRFLRILIKVRVPYKKELYDFGDYEVTFFENCFKCRQVRSGVKLNHQNTIPTYPDSTYGFCFGHRRHDIEDYAKHGRIIEALTLIIDCFHSVNPGDERHIPGCYRKVKTIEHAKRRLMSQ